MVEILCFADVMDGKNPSVGFKCEGETLTYQTKDVVDSCDINNIVKGLLNGQGTDHLARIPPQYLDVSYVQDFQQGLDIIQHAEDTFYDMPSNIREKFHNDTQEFLEFVSNPANQAKFADYGFIVDTPSEPIPAKQDAPQGAINAVPEASEKL